MTANDSSIPFDVYQSFCELKASVDVFSCLVFLIPSGEPDVFDFDSLGELLRLVSRSFDRSLDLHWRSLCGAEFVNR